MKNFIKKLYSSALSIVLVTLMISTSTTAQAMDVINGNACVAANLNQAFELSWDHGRVLNPSSNNVARFVTCAISTGLKYVDPADPLVLTTVESGGVTAVFVAGAAANSEVSCIFREMDNLDAGIGAVGSKVAVIAAPGSIPGTAGDVFVEADGLDIGGALSPHSLTVTCKLDPGTGINAYWANQSFPP